MDVQNYSQATYWLANSSDVSVNDGKFVKLGIFDQLAFRMIPSYQCETVQKIIALLEQHRPNTAEERLAHQSFSQVMIKRCNYTSNSAKKMAAYFERNLLKNKQEVEYLHVDNQAAQKKWERNGQPSAVFHKHPQFYDYLETTGLLSQMKITRDTVREINGEPCIMVEGQWTTLSVMKDTFAVEEAPGFGEKFIVHKNTRQVFTYLDNGKGLEQFHPYRDDLKPISHLSNEDYEMTIAKARKFIRQGEENLSRRERARLNAERKHVIQIVSSYLDGSNTNATNLLQRAKHPYIHLIAGSNGNQPNITKGDVFGVGFGWKQQPWIPLIASQGQFRSPDVWEYKSCQERVVTNIAVTTKEVRDFLAYTKKYHDDGINLGRSVGFHLLRQNCSVYVHNALQAINVVAPTEIKLNELIARIAPDWVKKVGRGFAFIKTQADAFVYKAISFISEKQLENFKAIAFTIKRWAKKIFSSATALSLVPLHIMAGGASGNGGAAFVQPGNVPERIEPTLRDWKNWFRLSSYKLHLPGILQEWQRSQASTVIYKNPVKLSIVPH